MYELSMPLAELHMQHFILGWGQSKSAFAAFAPKEGRAQGCGAMSDY